LSLDAPFAGDSQSSLVDILFDDDKSSPDSRAEYKQTVVLVRDWMSTLTDKQRLVITRRFGFDNGEVVTLEALSEELGVSRERVRQIQQEALSKLKRSFAAHGVKKEQLL